MKEKHRKVINDTFVEMTLEMVEALRGNPDKTTAEILYALTSIDGSLKGFNFNDSDKMAMLAMYHEVEEMLKKSKEYSEKDGAKAITVKDLIDLLYNLNSSALIYVSGSNGKLLPLDKILGADIEGISPDMYHFCSSHDEAESE